ncbi:MAG: glutamate 5-kinase [Deltaproteobacteria bacterium]|nr:MAG: glutamate 5-kinase [Deltaproteobacteria bacterium]
MISGAFKDVKRVVVKLGSQVLTDEKRALSGELFSWLAEDIKALTKEGVEVAIVSSGAVAAGMGRLGFSEPPATIPEKQALASVGQLNLMWTYREHFNAHGMIVAQILLTREDFHNRRRYQNAKNTMNELFKRDVVPVINENDTVVVEELRFGDNDNLSALVSNLIEADCLIILSDVEGLYDKDPKTNPDATLIESVELSEENPDEFIGESKTLVGTGGMASKLTAVRRAVHAGAKAVIASGRRPHALVDIFAGKKIGTAFKAEGDRLARRKHWIAYTVKSSGQIVVDEGAARAIASRGTSLLPKGIVSCRGDFDRGDAVWIVDRDLKRVAKGLTHYSAKEVEAIAGLASWEIVDRLGYKYYDEVVHRDDMVLGSAIEQVSTPRRG